MDEGSSLDGAFFAGAEVRFRGAEFFTDFATVFDLGAIKTLRDLLVKADTLFNCTHAASESPI